MLNNTQILENLNRLPEQFEQACKDGKWCVAAIAYENALLVSRFVRLDDVARDRLLVRFDPTQVETAYKAAGWYKEEQNADREGNRKKAV